jgi:hypothetical protein
MNNIQMCRKGKDTRKRDIKFMWKPTYQHLAAFVFVSSVLGEKIPTAEF